MKSFVLFALICFSDPSAVTGASCMNFWEEPIKYYKTDKKCLIASQTIGEEVKIKFEKQGIKIVEFAIWCIPVNN